MIWTNFHGHCKYCDGALLPVDYVKRAIDKQFIAYGFSSHGPVPFNSAWNIKQDNIQNYLDDVALVKEIYAPNIQIYTGLEADYIPGSTTPLEMKNKYELDYVIGSVHYVDYLKDGTPWEVDGALKTFEKGLKELHGNNIRKFIRRYFEVMKMMITEGKPDIAGHLDKIKIHNADNRYFSEYDKWYQDEVFDVLQLIRSEGIIIEVNTRGMYTRKTWQTYPSQWVLQHARKLGIPIMLNSDAHHPEEIALHYERTAYMLEDIGFKTMRILLNNDWHDIPFDENGLIADPNSGGNGKKLAS